MVLQSSDFCSLQNKYNNVHPPQEEKLEVALTHGEGDADGEGGEQETVSDLRFSPGFFPLTLLGLLKEKKKGMKNLVCKRNNSKNNLVPKGWFLLFFFFSCFFFFC